MKTILVTGADGQLGATFQEQVTLNLNIISGNYVFLGHKELDIADKKSVKAAFDKYKPNIVINCAAYTNVEGAEENEDKAHDINVIGVENLKKACKKNKAYLIHFSTDYVFDGEKNTPYTEEDKVNPLNIYGSSKLLGDLRLLEDENALIFRISWLYSNYGNNFFLKIKKSVEEGKELKIVNDQVGTPTYARDLVRHIISIISREEYVGKSGLYNYSDEGVCSWYDFAKMIEFFTKKNQDNVLNSIKRSNISSCRTENRKDKAKRPHYSVLDKTKFYNDFTEGKQNSSWVESLVDCFKWEYLMKKTN